MRKIIPFLLLFTASAYTQDINITQEQSEFYSRYNFSSEKEFDKLSPYSSQPLKINPPLTKYVFGWNPYWVGTAYNNYNYGLLSEIGYFSYEVDTATGSYKTVHFWKTTNIIPLAHSYNVKVSLTVTNFGSANNTKILGNATKRNRLIDSLIALVQLRNADGVNIDFESVPSSQRQNLTLFMTTLASRFHSQIPNSKVSICLPAVDWNNSFDIPALSSVCDKLIIMGYDYYWSTSPVAGPPAPLQSGSVWGSYNVTNSVNNYLQKGAAASKLLLGVPYYGYQWPTVSGNIYSNTSGSANAYQYASMKTRAATYGRMWDANSLTPWYRFQNSSWYQGWYEDSVSLGLKYDFVNTKNIGGIGIWALSYDGANNELWNTITRKFAIIPVKNISQNANEFRLNQNYPNPFNPKTKIRFAFPHFTNEGIQRGYITLVIYNSLGQHITTLVNERLQPGEYEVEFDAADFPGGVYFYKLIAGGKVETRKMILIK